MGQLDGQTAIVTGGGSGIGKAIARAYVGEGCAVAIAGRNQERLDAAAADLMQEGGRVLAVAADVRDATQVQELFHRTMAEFGRLDILVNGAALFDDGPIGTNLTGPFLCIRPAFPIFKAAGGGRIINIGSISAQRTRPDNSAYTASKFGIWGLTQAAALEGRPHGIAVSCLHPGNTAVEWRQQPDIAINQEPMIQPEDVARVALLMATLPPEANLLEAIVLPVAQLYVGRG